MFNSSFWPALCAFIAVVFAMFALIDFIVFVAAKYRERYIEETGSELDDVLIQMPPKRILEFSLALSVAGMTIAIVVLAAKMKNASFLWSIGGALLIGILLFPLPRLVLRFLRKHRLAKFNLQLEDAIGMISSALKAGFSINQAIEEVAKQNIHPLAVEFRLLVQELRLGVPFDQALDNMCNRLSCSDLDLVATAIITARQTGGELTSVLERVAELIRERIRIQRKVKALTAMGRLQALIIGATPFLLMGGLMVVNPMMMEGFFSSPLGIAALVVIIALVTGGFLMIRKITTIDI